MNNSDSHLQREALIFMHRAEQAHHRFFLPEEEFFAQPAQAYTPGLRDSLLLILGNWLIRRGQDLKMHSVHSQLSEEQA